MAKDLGTKHVCFKCKSKFYDLKKPAAICPKCGADQRDAPPPLTAKQQKKLLQTPKPAEAAEVADEPVADLDEDAVPAPADDDEDAVEEPEADEDA